MCQSTDLFISLTQYCVSSVLFLFLFSTERFVFCLSAVWYVSDTDLLTHYIPLWKETVPSLIILCCSNYSSLVVIDSDSSCSINIAWTNPVFLDFAKHVHMCHVDNILKEGIISQGKVSVSCASSFVCSRPSKYVKTRHSP